MLQGRAEGTLPDVAVKLVEDGSALDLDYYRHGEGFWSVASGVGGECRPGARKGIYIERELITKKIYITKHIYTTFPMGIYRDLHIRGISTILAY